MTIRKSSPSSAVSRFLSRLDGVKPCGEGWTGLCPAHDDHHNSLSVAQGTDGRVLVKCFVGCTAEEIAGARQTVRQEGSKQPMVNSKEEERNV